MGSLAWFRFRAGSIKPGVALGRFCLHSAGAVWSHAEHSTSLRGNFGNKQLFARSKPVLREALVLPGAGADLPTSTQSLKSCSTSVQSSPVCSTNTQQRFLSYLEEMGLLATPLSSRLLCRAPLFGQEKGRVSPASAHAFTQQTNPSCC